MTIEGGVNQSPNPVTEELDQTVQSPEQLVDDYDVGIPGIMLGKNEEASVDPQPAIDPIEAAVQGSIEATEIEPVLKEQPTVASALKATKIDRPDVKHTVNPHPKRPILTRVQHEDGVPALFGWAGTATTMTHVMQRLAGRMARNIRPTDAEVMASMAHQDEISSEGNHNFQYYLDAEWQPHANYNNKLIPNLYRIKNPEPGSEAYAGKYSVQLIKNRMGTGANIGVAMWHSGIYCAITAPDESTRLKLIEEIARNRVAALRNTSGILYGNSSYYINRALANCFLDHLTDCNIIGWDRELVRARIDHRDLQAMAWAMAYGIYPDGYNYTQLCGAVDESTQRICNEIQEFKLDFGVALLVDNNRLTPYQKMIMSETFKPHSIAQLDRYREEGVIGASKAYEISDGVKFVLQGPSLTAHVEQGHDWINSLVKITDEVIGIAGDEDQRNEYISRQINATKLREYSHWVKEIIMDDEVVISDRDKINELLNSLNTNNNVVTKLSDAIDEYQRQSVVQMVAIPREPCPACGGIDKTDAEHYPHLIPQDAVSRFFTLAHHELS